MARERWRGVRFGEDIFRDHTLELIWSSGEPGYLMDTYDDVTKDEIRLWTLQKLKKLNEYFTMDSDHRT